MADGQNSAATVAVTRQLQCEVRSYNTVADANGFILNRMAMVGFFSTRLPNDQVVGVWGCGGYFGLARRS
jgi:hypothetical protein